MASIRKRTLPASGKVVWQADYRDGAGLRRSRQFEKKVAATAFLTKTLGEVQQGIHTPDTASITVAEAGKLWIARCEAKRLERSTVKQYQEHLSCHIEPALGAERLSRLSTPRIEGFADQLAGKCSRALSRKVLVSLKSLIREAQRRGLVAQNVALPVKLEISRRDDELVLIPSKAELKAMLDKVGSLAPRWRPILITAMLTGLRPSELRGLPWAMVDLDAKVLGVRQRADAFNAIGAPKSRAGRREIPLSPLVVNTLREWRLACPKGPHGLVFPNTQGTLMHASDPSRLFWHQLMKLCDLVDLVGDEEIPRYDFRHLRHVAASLFIEDGASPKRIQQIMGHSSIKVTFDIYGHLFSDPEADQALAAGAERRLLG